MHLKISFTWSNVVNVKIPQTHQWNTSDRLNETKETDLVNTAERCKTKLTTQYHWQHFNQPGHQLKDIELIPLELINTKRESIRRARERFYIEKGTNYAATVRNKQRGRPLNHLCTYWFHHHNILYFILIYFQYYSYYDYDYYYDICLYLFYLFPIFLCSYYLF